VVVILNENIFVGLIIAIIIIDIFAYLVVSFAISEMVVHKYRLTGEVSDTFVGIPVYLPITVVVATNSDKGILRRMLGASPSKTDNVLCEGSDVDCMENNK